MAAVASAITTTSLPAGTMNAVYNVQLTSVGGVGNLTWSVVSGTLPGWVSLSSTGALSSNTLVGAGTYNFTVQVTDSGLPQQIAVASLTLTVNPPSGTTVQFTTQPSTASAGQAIAPPVQVRVQDGVAGVPNVTVTMAIGTNASGAILSGTATQVTDGTGTATFSNLSFDQGGDGYTLVASAASLTATSNPFDIIPSTGGVVTYAGRTWNPGPMTGAAAGVPLGPSKGAVVDGSGNVYSSDSGNNVVVKITPGGQMTVVAGIPGQSGFSGEGGPGTAALLNYPSALALDASGNLYIDDQNNGRVRKLDINGIITTVAGNGFFGYSGDGGPAVNAQLSGPAGVAVANGTIYIADSGNNVIRQVTSAGMISTFAGTGVYGYAGDGDGPLGAELANPQGLAVDASGNLYIADFGNGRIREIAGGVITTVAGGGPCCFGDGGPAVSAFLNSPTGIAFDGSGNLYIADSNDNRVREVDTTGTITTVAGAGAIGFSGDGGPATNASLWYPGGVAVDAAGSLYINDTDNNRIRKVTAGTINTLAGNGLFRFGGDGGPATSADLNNPWGTAVDAAGNLYVADWGNNRIRKVSPAHVITTFAGNGTVGYAGDGGPATAASLGSYELGIAVDAAGNVYFTDSYYGGRVRKVDTSGKITTVAGGVCCALGDGGPAVAANLGFPLALAVDGAGNLYIADNAASQIRKVDSNGIITTVAGTGTSGAPFTVGEVHEPAVWL